MVSTEQFIGMRVHYTSYGTPNGEYPSVCRAAVVTAVRDMEDDLIPVVVDLCVLNPEGLFFNRNVRRDDQHRVGGTWHLMEG
jgi:hypothetical protein